MSTAKEVSPGKFIIENTFGKSEVPYVGLFYWATRESCGPVEVEMMSGEKFVITQRLETYVKNIGRPNYGVSANLKRAT